MASEEENFDIDIYGDGDGSWGVTAENNPQEPNQLTKAEASTSTSHPHPASNGQNMQSDVKLENIHGEDGLAQTIASTDNSAPDPVHLPKQPPQTQGVMRKDGSSDDRYVDPGATSALLVSELQWWVNDDDLRGWANQSQCEDELEEITFNEHKVNGKSKGQAYILFKSPQAATATKQKIESFGEDQQYTKKFTVSYNNPYTNPFKILPKDGPMRNSGSAGYNRSTGYGGSGSSMPPQSTAYNHPSGGYRGGRGGGFNNRGAGMNNSSSYNRGFQQQTAGGFPGSQMGGFSGSSMGGMQGYGGFQSPGGMMNGMRGGMMGLPMNGMDMGAMGMGMGVGMGMNLPQVGTAMGMQGTRGSLSHMSATPVGALGLVVNPEARYTSSALQARKCTSSGSAASCPPATMLRGDTSPGMAPSPASTWATHNRHSPTASNLPITRLPFHLAAPATAFPPTQSDSMLKRKSSSTGPTGFQGYQTHYNPAMFNQQQQGQQTGAAGDTSWNPHGAKRTRHE